MIVLSILLVILLIALAAIVVRMVFNPQWVWLNRAITIFVAVAIIFGVIAVCGAASCANKVNQLWDRHDDIVLYYDTINECNNEYVRFDFYERVQEYNHDYQELVKKSESVWIGKLFPHNWYEQFGTIDFALKMGY